ncbi:MAG TPA: hypothetical protein VGB30_14575 [bacterium]|jgi:PBP1b-binding outer membrane lipoprotein LpoB
MKTAQLLAATAIVLLFLGCSSGENNPAQPNTQPPNNQVLEFTRNENVQSNRYL